MTKLLDARDLACPGPVLMVKDTIEKNDPDQLTILVDNPAAKENVTRFLESQNFSARATREGDDYKINGRRRGDTTKTIPSVTISQEPAKAQEQKIMVMVATDRLGFGDDDLGKKLMISFLKTVKEMGDELFRLVFVNNGVKLTIDGSPALDDLTAYEKEGLKILVCGTCLSHFGVLEAKKVGETTNMLDIVTAMQLADKVINL